MNQKLQLLNEFVAKAQLTILNLQAIKYSGTKVWPQVKEKPSECLIFSCPYDCTIHFETDRYGGDLYYMIGMQTEYTLYDGSALIFGGNRGSLYLYGTATGGYSPIVKSGDFFNFKVSGKLSAVFYWHTPSDGEVMKCNSMFEYITNLEDISELELFDYCNGEYAYEGMFRKCKKLKYVPEKLTVNMLSKGAFKEMFKECTALEQGMEFDCSESYEAEEAFSSIYEGCTSLVAAPPIRTKDQTCAGMDKAFYGCTALKTVEYLEHPGNNYCYQSAFENCTNLEEIPWFLYDNYRYGKRACERMFANCYKLKKINGLGSMDNFYGNEYTWYETFLNCTKLAISPRLCGGAGTTGTFASTFKNCTSITRARMSLGVIGGDGNLSDKCFINCFEGCSNLNDVTAIVYDGFPHTRILRNVKNSLLNVAAVGQLVTTEWSEFPDSEVPPGWTVIYY